MTTQNDSSTQEASSPHSLVRPLTLFIEFDITDHGDGPIAWRLGWHKAQFKDGYVCRVWWLFFAVAWVRMDLHDYNRHIASGKTEWRGAGGKRPLREEVERRLREATRESDVRREIARRLDEVRRNFESFSPKRQDEVSRLHQGYRSALIALDRWIERREANSGTGGNGAAELRGLEAEEPR